MPPLKGTDAALVAEYIAISDPTRCKFLLEAFLLRPRLALITAELLRRGVDPATFIPPLDMEAHPVSIPQAPVIVHPLVLTPMKPAMRRSLLQRITTLEALAQAHLDAADLTQDREVLAAQVVLLTSERDTFAGKTAQQADELATQAQRIDREQSATESARVELAAARSRIEGDAERRTDQAQEIQRLRLALEAEGKARSASEQTAAVLAAKLEGLREQVKKLRDSRAHLKAEREQARRIQE